MLIMDENQLKYKRLYGYSDEDLEYKNYVVKFDFGYIKKLIIRACCEEEIRTSKHKIISIKPES